MSTSYNVAPLLCGKIFISKALNANTSSYQPLFMSMLLLSKSLHSTPLYFNNTVFQIFNYCLGTPILIYFRGSMNSNVRIAIANPAPGSCDRNS